MATRTSEAPSGERAAACGARCPAPTEHLPHSRVILLCTPRMGLRFVCAPKSECISHAAARTQGPGPSVLGVQAPSLVPPSLLRCILLVTRRGAGRSGSFEAASPGQKGFLYKLKGFQRRTKTAFLKAATGSVEATHDVEYDGRHHDFTEMDKRTQNLRKRIDEFLKAQQRFCEAEEALSQALFDLYEEDNPQNGQVAAPLRDVSAGLYDLQIQVTQDLLPGLVAQWQSAVMGPVDRFQGRMSAINQDHERRSRYMADYDYYRSKDKRISDDTNIPEAKKEECKEKLANAQERFTAANNTLMSRMSAATQHKDALADETLLSTVALLRGELRARSSMLLDAFAAWLATRLGLASRSYPACAHVLCTNYQPCTSRARRAWRRSISCPTRRWPGKPRAKARSCSTNSRSKLSWSCRSARQMSSRPSRPQVPPAFSPVSACLLVCIGGGGGCALLEVRRRRGSAWRLHLEVP